MKERTFKLPTNKSDYALMTIFICGVVSILIGLVYTPNIFEIINGLVKIIYHHHRVDSELITVAGNTGSVFVNAGLLVLFMCLTFKIFKTDIKGLDLAAFGQIFGYSFYAESLLNVWPLFIGCMLEAVVKKKDLGSTVSTAWFATALAPFVSTLAFNVDLINPNSLFAIVFANVFGIVLGYGVGVFAGYMKTLHKGRLLFNMGLTTGTVGWIGNNFLKSFNIVQEPVTDQVYVEGRNMELWLVFMIFVVILFVAGAYYNKGTKEYFSTLFKYRSMGQDYTEEFGMGSALMNMGVIGLLALSYTLFTPYGQLNGPIIGGVFTVVGFAAFGLTIRGIFPVWLGIYGGSVLLGGIGGLFTGQGFLAAGLQKVSSRAMCVAAMHGLGSTPITEKDGWKSAATVGMLHTINTVNTGWLHGWMQSYNNGFSQGLIIVLFKPFWYVFSKLRTSGQSVTDVD